jgi:hypothetical protein
MSKREDEDLIANRPSPESCFESAPFRQARGIAFFGVQQARQTASGNTELRRKEPGAAKNHG